MCLSSPPPNLSEPQYAHLLFDHYCDVSAVHSLTGLPVQVKIVKIVLKEKSNAQYIGLLPCVCATIVQ